MAAAGRGWGEVVGREQPGGGVGPGGVGGVGEVRSGVGEAAAALSGCRSVRCLYSCQTWLLTRVQLAYQADAS